MKSAIRIIKQNRNQETNQATPEEKKPVEPNPRKMRSTVKNWVAEFQQRKRGQKLSLPILTVLILIASVIALSKPPANHTQQDSDQSTDRPLTPEERATVEKNIVFTNDAPAAAAAFTAKQVDAAVTWEPDLSASVTARGAEAHVLVSTQAATNIIADTLCARQELIDQAPETVRDFVRGWLDGIEMIKNNPNGSYEIVGKALKLDNETVSGMLSGLKLTPFADNAQFYGLTGPKAHYETLFDTAFVIWRKKGLVRKPVDAKGWADTRFLQAVAANYPGQKVEEAPVVAKAPSERDVPILHQQIQIQFTPGSDEIMPGSYLLLDKLGETMTSFGSTVLRVEGNTDSTGSATGNLTLSERRAQSVRNYIVKNFPNIPPTRFQTIGRGSSNPVAENTSEAGRQQNRRTDIKVILATQ